MKNIFWPITLIENKGIRAVGFEYSYKTAIISLSKWEENGEQN
jgi:hypothetical protein